ncbi:MAG: ABC transporter ATP-binding protein [Chloroflexi bacterium]|nr:ABC transporter ATP-binding protein [Chloroflexota bacterium]
MAEPDAIASSLPAHGAGVLLAVDGLCKRFPLPRGLIGTLTNRPAEAVHAIDGISFELQRGEILALVGESGCGKTTTALTLMGLLEADEGTIQFNGEDVTHLGRRGEAPRATIAALERQSFRREPSFQPTLTMKGLRRQVQMVFQDPYESLNPRATVYETVAEPLEVHGLAGTREELLERVRHALEAAGLSPAEDYLGRRPHELSGGQRQRVVIAGALVLEPILLIADEPVSMLDVSIRAEILNLLDELRTRRGISILCITHDLGTAAYFTDRIAVMYLGRIVETGPTKAVLAHPLHPYTQALLSVIPVPNPRLRRKCMILTGETPNPVHLPSGCRFHPRCPIAVDRCKQEDPVLRELGPAHDAACLLAEPLPADPPAV